jgi:hypothetical protein
MDNIVIWNVNYEDWRAYACDIANRDLAEKDWRRFIGEDKPYEETC